MTVAAKLASLATVPPAVAFAATGSRALLCRGGASAVDPSRSATPVGVSRSLGASLQHRTTLSWYTPLLAAGAAAASASRAPAAQRRRHLGQRARCVAVKAGAGAGAALEQSAVSQIDFRVGEVVSAERHAESEKLLVELIDIGEEAPRQICSGISAYYSPESLLGKRVVVVSNLKERRMAGTPSNGMVLCAHRTTGVRELALVEPPAAAAVGERVLVEIDGESHGPAAAPNRVQKKKLYEKVCDDFRTDSTGTVCYKDSPFQTSVGACRAESIPDGIVS